MCLKIGNLVNSQLWKRNSSVYDISATVTPEKNENSETLAFWAMTMTISRTVN
jgi:hypothetical protein